MAPFLGRLGNGGGTIAGFGFGKKRGGSRIPFFATGGSTSEPGDGYKYHVFDGPSSSSFLVESGSNEIQVLLQGGGGGGQSIGGSGSNSPGGAGGGGGATGVWTIPITASGTYPVSAGGAGGGTSLTNVNSTFISAGGPGGSNSTPWPGASLTGNYPGPGPIFSGGFGGTPGRPAGGVPQPGALWWRPYIGPGEGGGGGGHGSPQSATPGSPYGGGGGGGAGSFDGGPGGVGRPGAPGRVVIRYQI